MDWIYLGFVIFLFILAISDLWVGVSNDAVNFLNSAIGSKVAKFRTIIIIAAAGVFIGAIMSNGMMDIARHGIFRPEQFCFQEIMYICLAVMVTDIILLDVFNSLGMPTSTTVSMVFELLGATFAFSMLKIAGSDSGLGFSDYMNTEKALSVIMAIFVSVALAFAFGLIIQYISRLIFTFNYKKDLKWKIGIFGGIAATAIVYFLLIKGAKDLSFMTADVKEWIHVHTWQLLGVCLVSFTILMQILYFCKVNVFKVVVLIGTFALATAFAGNDLVNFIGVPLTGYASYLDYMASGSTDPTAHMMGVLNGPAKTPMVFLFLAGVVMVIALATSKKAHNVTKTEISLAKQDEGDEMFGSSKVARSIVRWSTSVANGLIAITPAKVRTWIGKRFDASEIEIEDGASYDLVRASVNLVVASMLIAFGTSLKLPLSTTYVTFMVAMGTSLADRAWSRESAVFRVTGVLSVIGGWFVTAGVAFTCAFIIALLMHFGGNAVAIIIVIAGLAALIHNNIRYKAKNEDINGDKEFKAILACQDNAKSWELLSRYVAENESGFLNGIADQYKKITDGLIEENVKVLRKSSNELKQEKVKLKNLRRKETLCLRHIDAEEGLRKSAWFHQVFNDMEQLYYSIRRICEPVYEHVDNNFSPLPEKYADEFTVSRDKVLGIIGGISNLCNEGDYGDLRKYDEQISGLQTEFSDMRKSLMTDIQGGNVNLTVAYLYLNLLQESEQMTIVLQQMSRASRKFQQG
ncbi:MAG: inorganic phosphate transporter [Bacteroidetes bacterium]|uniref:Phosphate transporter n=1 Tax=Candidatus Cryptobacteroides merdavium TaxID=2840769 RepID=A0A9D9ECG8_9BACT|nr:inorganic phosphate transporter [Candidatus Cryptobacteroides merdavium]